MRKELYFCDCCGKETEELIKVCIPVGGKTEDGFVLFGIEVCGDCAGKFSGLYHELRKNEEGKA